MCLHEQSERQEDAEWFDATMRTIDQGRSLEFGNRSHPQLQPSRAPSDVPAFNGGYMPTNSSYAASLPNVSHSFEAEEAPSGAWNPEFIHQSRPWLDRRPVHHRRSASTRPKEAWGTIPMHVALRRSCTFCPGFGVTFLFSRSHRIRSLDGKVTCPVLRAYNCSLCNNGGGDDAHTEGFCPTLPNPKKPKVVHLIARPPRDFQ